jgi:addiction module HigA family antidote
MKKMYNPPHPGEVLKEYLGDVSVTQAASNMGVNRVTLSRIISGSAGISADMAYRLASAFGTSPELWAGMQLQYDLFQASKLKRPKIQRLAVA